MKLESLVIANQDVAVNTSLGLAHTARHVLGVDLARRFRNKLFKLKFDKKKLFSFLTKKESPFEGQVSNWDEVVTR